MPVFESAELDCDFDQLIGRTTATKMRHRQRGATLTLWCGDCEEFHGFVPSDSA